MLFFIFILLIESMLFFSLYFAVINERVQSEIDNLIARGSNHRDVLEKNYDSLTFKHVALMESEAETMVVITDDEFEVLHASNMVNKEKLELIEESTMMELVSQDEIIVESRWERAPYLATVSPIRINGKIEGYVYMFLNTESLRSLIQNLTMQFIIVGGIATLILLITMVFLSRFITTPLLQMKKVTEQLSEGKNNESLDVYREDELGDLAKSIKMLSDNLYRLKQERSEFLSSISHELRTPLTYLKGYADILKRPNLTPEEREEYLDIIQEEVSNVTTLVKDLFDLAKMDQNHFIIKKENVNLCEYLHEIVLKFKPAFEEQKMSLHFSCEDTIGIDLDPIRFGQVMNNLIDNALKYSSDNTHIWISAVKDGQSVVIKVADQGEGIPQDEIPCIWDRLYRVDKSRSRSTGGSGLGLSIAKEIIDRHGGKVEVSSQIGKGTTFTVILELE
jgi:signal transduction histidine kinase